MKLASVRPLAFISVLGLLAAGCGEQEDVSPNFEDRIPAGLELRAADRVLDWGKSTVLDGTLTRGDDELAGETVTLESDPYPFRGDFSELESTETDERGRFTFEAEPDSNTTYRVVAGERSETASAERRVYVEPLMQIFVEPAGRGTRFTTVFRHPEERSLAGSSFFSYAATVADAAATGELNFVRVDRLTQVEPGRTKGSIVLPFAAEEVRYSSCVSYTGDAGLGRPGSRCSQSEIRAK